MVAPTYANVPLPKKAYRIDRNTCRADGEIALQSIAEAQKEDRYRIKSLGRTKGLSPEEAALAEDLRKRMKRAVDVGKTPGTLASAEKFRSDSVAPLSHRWKLIAENPHLPAAFVTVRPQGMIFEMRDLPQISPRGLGKRIRNHLDRAGVTKAPGFLFGGIDAEFDENRGEDGVIDFHGHFIVAGEKLEALEELRKRPSFKNDRSHPLESGLKESPRLQIKADLFDMPTPLVYCLKGWVPHRPTFLLPDGTRDRSDTKCRIPSPYHQQWLIWMDRWKIDDFILMNGIRTTKSGFSIIS